MTGNEIINAINEANTHGEEVLIEHNGKVKVIHTAVKFGNTIILSDRREQFSPNLKEYFSNWYKIIPFDKVLKTMLAETVYVLRQDGTSVKASDLAMPDIIKEYENQSLFGTLDSAN